MSRYLDFSCSQHDSSDTLKSVLIPRQEENNNDSHHYTTANLNMNQIKLNHDREKPAIYHHDKNDSNMSYQKNQSNNHKIKTKTTNKNENRESDERGFGRWNQLKESARKELSFGSFAITLIKLSALFALLTLYNEFYVFRFQSVSTIQNIT